MAHHPRPRRAPATRGPARASALLVLAGLLLAACSSGGGTTAPTTTHPATTSVPTTSTTAPTASLGSYLPLYPFASVAEVATWQQANRSRGATPWHLDAGQSALSFAAWLGYTGVDTVVASRTDASGAHVSVGYRTEGAGNQLATAAVVHLVRWGTGSDAPWEVVGTDDTTFSLTTPRYGTTGVTSPLAVGGVISGVDENISVQVRTLASASAIGTSCCTPAGGSASPWHATVAFSAPSGSVLTIAATTGGHLTTVERFTATGARA